MTTAITKTESCLTKQPPASVERNLATDTIINNPEIVKIVKLLSKKPGDRAVKEINDALLKHAADFIALGVMVKVTGIKWDIEVVHLQDQEVDNGE